MTTSPRAFILNLSNSNLAKERVLINSPLVDVATATNHMFPMREQNTNGFLHEHLKSNFQLEPASYFRLLVNLKSGPISTIRKNTGVVAGCIYLLRYVKRVREVDGVIRNSRNVGIVLKLMVGLSF